MKTVKHTMVAAVAVLALAACGHDAPEVEDAGSGDDQGATPNGGATTPGQVPQGGDTPELAVEQFAHSLADENTTGSCSQMTDMAGTGPMATSADNAQCLMMMQYIINDPEFSQNKPALKMVKVTGADVQGDKAYVAQSDLAGLEDESSEDKLELVKLSDGRWYINTQAFMGPGDMPTS